MVRAKRTYFLWSIPELTIVFFIPPLQNELGLTLRDGWAKEFGGISAGEPVQAYMHKISMQLQGFSEIFEIEAGFADSDAIGGLLGQVGFFDCYKVTLEGYKGRFQIHYRPDANGA
jgi:hypothetical protein